MKILLTGASSFTGYWIARALVEAGHEVVAPLLRSRDAYLGDNRAERVRRLESILRLEPECGFGSERFFKLIEQGFDILAHHAAQVGDYRRQDFDVLGAVAANTNRLGDILASGNIGSMVLTSSVFAPNEGVGTLPLRAFSPYGLSKGITNEFVTHLATQSAVPLGRFVIPNPFGPLEEPRFCAYLMRSWKSGQTARVNTPLYVRDNIHVSLLAECYRRYVEALSAGSASPVHCPSGYIGTQGDFAARVSIAVKSRTGWSCNLEIAEQSDFSEPIMRINTEPAAMLVKGWSETRAWDDFVDCYR